MNRPGPQWLYRYLSLSRFPVLQALLAGVLHAWALSHQGSVNGWLQVLALVWLAGLIAQSPRVMKAALIGWLFALAWLVGSVWWLYISMHQYGGMPSVLAALAVVLLCAGLALIYALAMALVRKVSRPATVSIVGFSAAWLLAELMRGWIFTGFPWASSGYAQVDNVVLNAYAPWLGVYGIGAVAALLAASVATIFFASKDTWRQLVAAWVAIVVVLGLHWPLRHDFTEPAGTIKVALLQGNVPQNLKFEQETMLNALHWYLNELLQAQEQGVDLVVAPETAIPTFPSYLPRGLWEGLRAEFAAGDTAALIGIPLRTGTTGVTNSMIGLAPGQALYQYDKHHLVPFGEFIPWGFRWFVDMMDIPLGDMDRGAVDATSLWWRGQRIAPNICYEDLFGEELARRFAVPGQEPTIMANASNIAWFGDTVALPQHLQIARMRSLEFQRPMIRATNTGVTAIIDDQGRVQDMLAPFTQGVLVGDVQGRQGLTFYVSWVSAWGLLPLWLYGLVTISFLLLRTRTRVSN